MLNRGTAQLKNHAFGFSMSVEMPQMTANGQQWEKALLHRLAPPAWTRNVMFDCFCYALLRAAALVPAVGGRLLLRVVCREMSETNKATREREEEENTHTKWLNKGMSCSTHTTCMNSCSMSYSLQALWPRLDLCQGCEMAVVSEE